MYEQYVIVYCTGWAHLSGTQRPCTRFPWDIKGRSTLEQSSNSIYSRTQAHLESTSNTTHSGRRVLRSGGPNHSNSWCVLVFLLHGKIWRIACTSPGNHLLRLGGCFPPPGRGPYPELRQYWSPLYLQHIAFAIHIHVWFLNTISS